MMAKCEHDYSIRKEIELIKWPLKKGVNYCIDESDHINDLIVKLDLKAVLSNSFGAKVTFGANLEPQRSFQKLDHK